ncbi:hypothetical protein ACHAW6_004336 [Cyclotella cf. meneghiniana]
MHQIAEFDPSTAKSQSGCITFYAGCPIIWNSKLQTQVALLTTEAEYTALSHSLHDVIPIMQLLEAMKSRGFEGICTSSHVFCKTFKATPVLLNWHACQSYVLSPSTSMSVIIIFVNISAKV